MSRKMYSYVCTKQDCINQFFVAVTQDKTVHSATLSPISAATYQHSMHTYCQVQTWLGLIINPDKWGWKLMKQIRSSCKADCSKSCGYKKAGLKWNGLCKNCGGPR